MDDEILRTRVASLIERGASLDEVIAAARAAAGPGQCRIRDGRHDGIYPDVRPVLDTKGLRWCCSANPPHCTQVVAPLDLWV
jgi:hypothetical protein